MTDPFQALQEAVSNAIGPGDGRRPRLFLDGRDLDLSAMPDVLRGERASVIGAHGPALGEILARLDVETLGICDSRADDFSALARMPGLRRLDIRYATRLSDAGFLGHLGKLDVLSLYETPRLFDLAPVSEARSLRALDFSGGFSAPNKVRTLAPLGTLGALEVLRLTNLRVTEGGLRPLAGCTGLRSLDVSNQFETADYAYLSVMLPKVECSLFNACSDLGRDIGGADVMVTGKRKPFLNSTRDATRLEKYRKDFAALQDGFRAARD